MRRAPPDDVAPAQVYGHVRCAEGRLITRSCLIKQAYLRALNGEPLSTFHFP
jgi:hypothetical protein